MKTINHHLRLRDLFFDRVRVTFVHIGADTLNARPQLERDRAQEGHYGLLLPIGKYGEQRNVAITTSQGDNYDKIAVTFAQGDFVHPDDFQCRELAPVDRARHASIDRPQDRVITDLLLARHITDRTVDQLPQQRLIESFGVRRTRLVPSALLRGRRMIVANRTAIPLRAQLDKHALFQNRQMPNADRIVVAVKLKGLLPAAGAGRIGARALDRNDDLALFQFGLQHADFRQIQRKLDHWRHRSVPFKRGLVRPQPATTSTALQDHKILGFIRQFPESRNFEPIFILGQENIELEKELIATKDKLKANQETIRSLTSEKDLTSRNLDSLLTTKAAEYKRTLSITEAYTKRNLENLLNQSTQEESGEELTEESITTLINQARSTEKKDKLSKIEPKIEKLHEQADKLNQLLSTIVTALVIKELQEDGALSDWVRAGKTIHEGKYNCGFCGGKLDEGLISKLNSHFSDQHEQLMRDLDSEISKTRRYSINLTLLPKAVIYQELQQEYESACNQLTQEVHDYNDLINILVGKLSEKKSHPFTVLPAITISLDAKDAAISTHIFKLEFIDASLKALNIVIDKHNARTDEFEQLKIQARGKVLNYWASQLSSSSYNSQKAQIAKLNEQITEIEVENVTLSARIASLEEILSETAKGAEKINQCLSKYFGKSDISVNITEDKKYQLFRSGKIARNLSNGERTAIAFVYFMTSLEDKNTDLKDTIVFIDDPISSLDSNHLFNIYAFIKDRFYEFDSTSGSGKKHLCKAAQLFISTHNYEFFNILKEWYVNMKITDTSYYFIEKLFRDNAHCSHIIELPLTLKRFKSEYVYLFSYLFGFHENPEEALNLDRLYNLPNVARRFIENFTAIKFLARRNIEESVELFIVDSVEQERVRKFVHYYSHSLDFSAEANCQTPMR